MHMRENLNLPQEIVGIGEFLGDGAFKEGRRG